MNLMHCYHPPLGHEIDVRTFDKTRLVVVLSRFVFYSNRTATRDCVVGRVCRFDVRTAGADMRCATVAMRCSSCFVSSF